MEGTFQLPPRLLLHVDSSEKCEENTASSKGLPWTEVEHLNFLQGLRVFGKGKWRQISRVFLNKKKTPTQVASHAQKYFARLQGTTKRKSRFTSLEEKAHSVSPVAGNPEALQALQALPHTHLPAQPGFPAATYLPLKIEPLCTPDFPEPAQMMACQSLAKLCQPLTVRAASPPTCSGEDSCLSCSSQHAPAVNGPPHPGFTQPPGPVAAA